MVSVIYRLSDMLHTHARGCCHGCLPLQDCAPCAGALEAWPARTTWRSLRWWAARHGLRSVPVELGAGAAWREAVLTLRELVERHLAPSACGAPGVETAYLAQHALLDQARAPPAGRRGSVLVSACVHFNVRRSMKAMVSRPTPSVRCIVCMRARHAGQQSAVVCRT